MNWAKLLLTLAEIMAYLVKYATDRQLLDAGQQKALASLLRQQADVLKTADEARQEARANNARIPKSDSLPTDGFRRD